MKHIFIVSRSTQGVHITKNSPYNQELFIRAQQSSDTLHQSICQLKPDTELSSAINSIDRLNAGETQPTNPIYSRLHNDTVAGFEQGLAELEDAESAIAFASGMAAITALLLAAKQSKNGAGHVIAVRTLYGGTDSLLSSNLLGLPVTWLRAGDSIQQAIRPETALVWIETPANPTCDLIDISAVVTEANGIPVAVDSTFATPILQQPLRLGASYVVHSATKFIGGHSDVLAGVIACSAERARPIRKIRIQTGANLHPLAAYMLHRGLQTLDLRVRCAQENATFLATQLSAHSKVLHVHHPSLNDPQSLIGDRCLARVHCWPLK